MAIGNFLSSVTAAGCARGRATLTGRPRGEISDRAMKGLAIAGGVIVVALVIYFNTAGAKPYGFSEKRYYRCSECGHEFALTQGEVTEARVAAGDPGKIRMLCPKCGKDTGIPMLQCEKCDHWFLPEGDGNACPKCGHDPYGEHPGELGGSDR